MYAWMIKFAFIFSIFDEEMKTIKWIKSPLNEIDLTVPTAYFIFR